MHTLYRKLHSYFSLCILIIGIFFTVLSAPVSDAQGFSPKPMNVYTKPDILKSASDTKFFNETSQNQLYAPNKPLTEILPGFIVDTLFFLFSSLSVVFALMAGYKIIFSKGDQKKVQEGIQTIVYALLGLIIIGSAWMVVRIVLNISFGG